MGVNTNSHDADVLILGCGSVGLTVAHGLKSKRPHTKITVVEPYPYVQYPAFLPEAAASSIDAEDAVAPLNLALKGVDVVQASATKITHAHRSVTVKPDDGDAFDIKYDQLVVGLGAVSRMLPIPGLAENSMGFKTIDEGIALRDQVLERLESASHVTDPEKRARMLTFTFVGAGFAGVEAITELEDLVRDALEQYQDLTRSDMRFIMVEASNRILPEVTEESGQYVLKHMLKRDIEVLLNTTLDSCIDKHVVLSDGQEFDSDTIVWTAGVKANPLLSEASDLPIDEKGRVTVLPTLQVADKGVVVEGAWAAGDCAAVPDVVSGPGKLAPPNAQYAVRASKVLAKNLSAHFNGEPLQDFVHKNIGVVASFGMNKGVAEFLGGKIKLHGWLAWMAHRSYHVYAMPTMNRRMRILGGWIERMLKGRDLSPEPADLKSL